MIMWRTEYENWTGNAINNRHNIRLIRLNHQCVCVSFNYSLANAVQLFSCSFAQSDNSIDKGLLPIRKGFDAYSFAEELNKKSKEYSRIFETFHTHSGMLRICIFICHMNSYFIMKVILKSEFGRELKSFLNSKLINIPKNSLKEIRNCATGSFETLRF